MQTLGERPQVGPIALLHCIRIPIHLFVIFSMCELKLSLLSKVTPRSLTSLESVIGVPGEHYNFCL